MARRTTPTVGALTALGLLTACASGGAQPAAPTTSAPTPTTSSPIASSVVSPTPTTPSITPAAPDATAPPGTTPDRAGRPPLDLTTVALVPDGYVPVDGETLSGPITSDADLARTFGDDPTIPKMLRDNGFDGGYLTVSRRPPATGSTVTMTATLLRTTTPDRAQAALKRLRESALRRGLAPLPAPSDLPGSYAVSLTEGTLVPSYLYAVAWVRDDLIIEISQTYDARPSQGATETIALARAQNARIH